MKPSCRILDAPSVLIVGAGAMGLVAGYHLQLGGTRITFLVRPGRAAAFRAPQLLYCYDDGQLKRFDGYDVIETMAAAQGRFDYVISTLDGATARSAQGTAVLRDIGNAIRDESTILLMGGVGIGLREHYLQSSGLPPERVMGGFLGLLAHQLGADIPPHPPTRADVLATASIAYRHAVNRNGFLVETRIPAAADAFARLYDRSGVSRCGKMSPALVNIVTNSAFPMLAASQIAGWPDVTTLVSNRALWRLACAAQGEIAALPQHGFAGKLARLLLTPGISAWIQRKVEKGALPLDYQAFNRFHHGDKVHAQDVEVMRNCLASGEQQGHPMPALRELLRQLAEHDAQRAAA